MAKIVCFGEILLRLSAFDKHRLQQANGFSVNYVGAEANVAVGLSNLGHQARFISALPDNPLGVAARAAVMAHGVSVIAPAISDSRLGVYFFETGAGLRPPSIIYDRQSSAFATCAPKQYDWQDILKGQDRLHLSGISLALSETAKQAAFAAAECASDMGLSISFDCNFRASLWKGREREAAPVIRDLARFANLIFGGAKDAELLFDLSYNNSNPEENFRRASAKFLEFSPAISHVAATHRIIESADANILQGYIAGRDETAESRQIRVVNIVDRIGSGDAFVAAAIHKLAASATLQETIDFAVAAAAIKHTIPGDFNIAAESEIDASSKGASDVRR